MTTAVYAEVRSRGIPIARPFQQESWPARGFNLKDPSGNDVGRASPPLLAVHLRLAIGPRL